MAMNEENLEVIDCVEWIKENEKFFLPPVCNKMLHHKGQLKMFYVGGPNQRNDYHLEEGEELFYQMKGDMTLKIMRDGTTPYDVHIKEGDIFLLPSNVPHSPQRQSNTIGWVIERHRIADREFDGLLYFVNDGEGKPTTKPLFQRWFYCDDLGSQLAPIIKEFFESPQHRTGQPLINDPIINAAPKCLINPTTKMTEPFNLRQWISKNQSAINESRGKLPIFPVDRQTHVFMLSGYDGNEATHSFAALTEVESFIWQFDGQAAVHTTDNVYPLRLNDTILIPENTPFSIVCQPNSATLYVSQDPKRKETF